MEAPFHHLVEAPRPALVDYDGFDKTGVVYVVGSILTNVDLPQTHMAMTVPLHLEGHLLAELADDV
jgi:hypothetical protein